MRRGEKRVARACSGIKKGGRTVGSASSGLKGRLSPLLSSFFFFFSKPKRNSSSNIVRAENPSSPRQFFNPPHYSFCQLFRSLSRFPRIYRQSQCFPLLQILLLPLPPPPLQSTPTTPSSLSLWLFFRLYVYVYLPPFNFYILLFCTFGI